MMTGTPLQHGYTFYYMRRSKGGKAAIDGDALQRLKETTRDSFTDAVKPIGTATTIEEFLGHLQLPRAAERFAGHDGLSLLQGVKPTWEDPYNERGGRWTMRLPKRGLLGSRYWEEILLSILGGGMDVPDGEICGSGHLHVLSVWNKSAGNTRMVSNIKNALRKLLKLPRDAPMRYHNHPRQ
ncbi:hypothetical protein ACHAXT_008782 [Thalassiosira profunda]